MIRCIVFFLLLFSAAASHSQTVNVRLLKDEPVKTKGFKILFEPFYFNTWKPNGHGGFGFGFLVNGGSLFTGEMNMRFAYGDKYHVKGDNSIPKFNNTEFMLSWHFGKETTQRSYKVKIADYETHYTYVMVDMKRRAAFGFRTGFSILSTGVDYASIFSYYIKDTDTNYLSGKGKYASFMAVGGLSLKFVHNALVSLDGYRRPEGGCSEFFFDVMPLVGLDISSVVPAYDTISYDVHIPAKQKLGMRFGWRFYDPSRSNFTFGLQYGTYAGPDYGKDPNFFLMTFGFSIGDKLKE